MSLTQDEELAKAVEILKPVVKACYDIEQTKPKVEAVVDKALHQIVSMVNEAIQKHMTERVNKAQSFCGCSMCLHHSEPFQSNIAKKGE